MHRSPGSIEIPFRRFMGRICSSCTASTSLLFVFILLVTPAPGSIAQTPTGLPPGDPFDLVSDHLEWNVWVEEMAPGQTEPSFRPLSNPPEIRDFAWHLQPKRDYLLVVHLSEHRYRDGMAAHPTAEIRLRQSLAALLASTPMPKSMVLTGTLQENPEPVGFRVSSPRRARLAFVAETPPPVMTVQLGRLLKQIQSPSATTPADASPRSFSILAQRKDADFVYGQLMFRFNTGRREGMVGLAITLSAQGEEADRLDRRIELCIATKANERKACPPPAMASVRGDDNAINKLQWNFWTELHPTAVSKPQFVAAPALSPDKGGLLVLDLAALTYKQKGVSSRSVGTKLKDAIEEWLKTLPPSVKEVPITVVAVPDRAFFELADGQPMQQSLNIKLDKIRTLKESNVEIKVENPLQVLANGEDPVWELGNIAYPIKTLPNEGMTSVAFSIWAEQEGKQRPVDEMVATFCIAKDPSSCKGAGELSSGGLSGLDTLKLSSEPDAPFPDAAVHFVSLGDKRLVMGVFRNNDRPKEEFVAWQLERSKDGLKKQLSDSLLDAVAHMATDKTLRSKGGDLYKLLFPSKSVNRGNAIPPSEMDDGHKARLAFEAFVKDHVKSATVSSKGLPSVFVRLLGDDDLIPLGLLPIAAPDNAEEFLGFRFRVETPLKVQSYRSQTTCISDWTLVVPPPGSKAALGDARKQASGTITKWEPGTKWLAEVRDPNANAPTTMDDFEAWLGAFTEDPSPKAVVVLSHHGKNQLSFDDSIAQSNSVQRTFFAPSVAILNGCGTAKPEESDFITQLNDHGMRTVIASSAEVEGQMAGDFFNCLDAALNEHAADATYTLSQAYADTLQCLKDTKPEEGAPKYGARALKYVLLGNGNLKLCLPK